MNTSDLVFSLGFFVNSCQIVFSYDTYYIKQGHLFLKYTEFEKKEQIFFERHNIKINPKTRTWNKQFYIDQHLEFQIGKIPRENCKLCANKIKNIEKGHGIQFCSSYCKKTHFKIRKIFEELQKMDSNIISLRVCPKEKITSDGQKIPLSFEHPKIKDVIVEYKDLTQKPLSDVRKRGRPKTSSD